jgi:hypothetical protein
MTNRVILSCWIRGFTEHNLLANFEKALWRFPFSRLAPRAHLTVRAVDYAESPVDECLLEAGTDAATIIDACRDFLHADCAFEVDAFWDLWQESDGDWTLQPSPVRITCYAPLFPSELGEQLRLELGADSLFLPSPDDEAPPLRAIQSNIRSVLRLASDLEQALALEKRLLWAEDGENLAERLTKALEELEGEG